MIKLDNYWLSSVVLEGWMLFPGNREDDELLRSCHVSDAVRRKTQGTLEYWASRVRDQAENAYDHALETLEELLGDDIGLAQYLDRPVSFDQVAGTVSADADGVPRLITAKSHYARTTYANDVREAKIQALESSLDACG